MKNQIFILMAAMVLLLVSCGGGGSTTGKQKQITLSAAGATFPQPFYNLAFKKYNEAGGPLINYGGIGSGGGIKSLRDQIVDFAATDAYLSDAELAEMPGEVVHIPTCIGAVVIAYNLPGVTDLQLTPNSLKGSSWVTLKSGMIRRFLQPTRVLPFPIWRSLLSTVLTAAAPHTSSATTCRKSARPGKLSLGQAKLSTGLQE